MNKCIGLRIKEIREAGKLNRIQFAELLKMNNGQYGKIENGLLMPTLTQVIDVHSNFPNTDLHWLLTGEKSNASVKDYTVEADSDPLVAREIEVIYTANNRLSEALDDKQKIIVMLEKQISRLEDENKMIKADLKRFQSEKSKA